MLAGLEGLTGPGPLRGAIWQRRPAAATGRGDYFPPLGACGPLALQREAK